MGRNSQLDDSQIGAAWNSISQDNKKDPFSADGLEKVKAWFLDGFVHDNATVLQTIPDVLFEGVFKDTKRSLYIEYVFQPLTMTSQVLLRMLWHVCKSRKIDGVTSFVAAKLLSFVVVRCNDSEDSIARRWRMYDSIGRHENINDAFMASFVDWYNRGFGSDDADIARDINVFPILDVPFLSETDRVKLKVDWETNVSFRCVCRDPSSKSKWVECENGIRCAGLQWYHADCTNLESNNDVCEFCVEKSMEENRTNAGSGSFDRDDDDDDGSAEGNDENVVE